MACQINAGNPIGCLDSGGVQAVYFFNYGDITPTFDLTNTELVTDLGTASAYKYAVRSASNLVETQTATDNGVGVEQVITLIINGQNANTGNQLRLMGKSLTHAVVHFKNGDSKVVGLNFGARLTTAVADSGTAIGDGTFYTLTINGQEMSIANHLDGSTISDPFVGLSSTPNVVV
jgi:hypothetical protein